MKSRIRSLMRMMKGEVSWLHKKDAPKKSMLTKNLTFYDTATGKYYLPTDAHEDVIAHAIKSNRIYDEEVVTTAQKYIKKDTAVLDVGANFGQMSILFSNMTGEGGKVYSFEADDWVYEILKKNIAANGKEKTIIPCFGAVYNQEGQVLHFPVQDFKQFGTYGSYGIDYNGKQGRDVQSLTIDSLDIKETISFMKIDIQGGDLQAMQGAVKTIEKNKMPILFEYEYLFEDKFQMKFQDYVDFVLSINYRFEKMIYGHNYLILPN